MRIRPGIIVAIVVVFLVLLAGRQAGWFGKKYGSEPPVADNGADTARDSVPPRPSIELPGASQTAPPVAPKPPVAGQRGSIGTPGTAPATPAVIITEWEERIDNLLTAQGDETQKAKQLLEIFPNLPEDGQIEAAQHISNLLPDEEYASLAPALINPQTPEEVLDVLMTDVLNRPNNLKLGTLLEVARTPNHPKAEEALDVLEVYVDENYGQDWAAWDAAVKKWLQENPDE